MSFRSAHLELWEGLWRRFADVKDLWRLLWVGSSLQYAHIEVTHTCRYEIYTSQEELRVLLQI